MLISYFKLQSKRGEVAIRLNLNTHFRNFHAIVFKKTFQPLIGRLPIQTTSWQNGNIKHRPPKSPGHTNAESSWKFVTEAVSSAKFRHGIAIVMTTCMETEVLTLFTSTMANPRFWSMKIKIALLAAATFAAMC